MWESRFNSQSKKGQVSQHCTTHERCQQDGPVRERLFGQVRQDNLRSHAAKDKAHGQAEQNQPVFREQCRVRGVEPQPARPGEDDDGSPLEEDWQDGEVLATTRNGNVIHARRQVRDQERADQDGHPEVTEAVILKQPVVAGRVFELHLPDPRTIVTRN
jgi:hypothetical protein